MAYLRSAPMSVRPIPAMLTAPLALTLAENALKRGRIESATRYVNIAYAIFDANIAIRASQTNAAPRYDD